MKSPVSLGFQTSAVGRAALRGDADFFRHFVAVGRVELHRRRSYSRGSVLSIVNGMRTDLAGDAERRGVEAQQLDIRQPLRAADRHGEHRHVRHAAAERPLRPAARPRSSRRRRPARSPAATAIFSSAAASGVQIGAAAGRRLGERLHHDVEPFARAVARFRFA